MFGRTLAATATIAAGLIALSGCSTSPSPDPAEPAATPTPVASPSPEPSDSPAHDLQLSSNDFEHGDVLPDWTTGSALAGQCSGDNVNPHLTWTGLPEGTVSVAITMIDESAGDWLHWLHLNLPPEITTVERGASGDLPGAVGRNGLRTQEYFGPCPPRGEHHYTFTVWALDTMLDLGDGAQYGEFIRDRADHVLAEASITGSRAYTGRDS